MPSKSANRNGPFSKGTFRSAGRCSFGTLSGTTVGFPCCECASEALAPANTLTTLQAQPAALPHPLLTPTPHFRSRPARILLCCDLPTWFTTKTREAWFPNAETHSRRWRLAMLQAQNSYGVQARFHTLQARSALPEYDHPHAARCPSAGPA